MSIAFVLSALLGYMATPSTGLELQSMTPANTFNASSKKSVLKVACRPRSNSGREAPGPCHGDDPHGDDPNDEQHPDLPNGGPDLKHYGDGYPSKDPYNDSAGNSRKPYLAPGMSILDRERGW